MIEFLLPRTDSGAIWQAAITAVVLSAALFAVRRDREVRLLVMGITMLAVAWFALRGVH